MYLGFILNSRDMTVRPTSDKIQKIIDLSKKRLTIRELAEIVGSLIALEPGADMAPLRYRRLDIYKADMLKFKAGNFNAKIRLTDDCREDLAWWVDNVHTVSHQINRPKATLILTSDSSDFAWGGTCNEQTTGGAWTEEEQEGHINVKELMAAFLTLKSFCTDLRDLHIRLKMDNTTCVAYVNKKGGRIKSLNDITRDMWLWAEERNIWMGR